ncbi:hypothetical protein FZEAL_9668 [Fusarium zealandicum]|uniref:Uncharacterized protein n=1 Tax=Fusarium zealandicum TaxID=1053134 RepID=A0A8H4XFA3_9HYPO|nr:hypothetical protein FZEAL_9668 [Fusarium zealandicum]
MQQQKDRNQTQTPHIRDRHSPDNDINKHPQDYGRHPHHYHVHMYLHIRAHMHMLITATRKIESDERAENLFSSSQ